MPNLVLQYPVHTIDNQLLLTADTELSQHVIDELVSSNRASTYLQHPILRHGTVQQDLINYLGREPYNAIFTDQERINSIFSVMEKVSLAAPLLDSLDYFKQNDSYTYRHLLVVFALSTLLSKDLIHDYAQQIQGISTGPFHDIGKTCVPLKILKKATPLSTCERKLLMHHTAAGYVLTSFYLRDPLDITAIVARDHHERRDGSGHPGGTLLDELIVEIVSVCDVYDALLSPRPYRPVSYDNRTALEVITAMAEKKQIRWEVVRALVAHNRKKTSGADRPVSVEKRGIPPALNSYGKVSEEDQDCSG